MTIVPKENPTRFMNLSEKLSMIKSAKTKPVYFVQFIAVVNGFNLFETTKFAADFIININRLAVVRNKAHTLIPNDFK